MICMNPTIVARAICDQASGRVRHDVFVEVPGEAPFRLFYEIVGERVPPPVRRLDFVVLALLYFAMRRGLDLHVEGAVSRRLLANLEEFQRAWAMWLPGDYRHIRITARDVVTDTTLPADDVAVAAFSGGVDAVFALARHVTPSTAYDRCRIATAVLVHGFDIGLDQEQGFRIAETNARALTAAMNVPLTVVRTDWRARVARRWEHEYVTGLSACLFLFGEVANVALMGNGEDYRNFEVPWGSNPVTNPLLTSATMRNVTEGAAFTRTEKVRVIAGVPGIGDRLRVCWQGPQTGQNCGRCEKCIRTKLNFLANDLPIPGSLGAAPGPVAVARIRAKNQAQIALLEDVLLSARHSSMSLRLRAAIRFVIFRSRVQNGLSGLRKALRARPVR
jgi:hypothetical protein